MSGNCVLYQIEIKGNQRMSGKDMKHNITVCKMLSEHGANVVNLPLFLLFYTDRANLNMMNHWMNEWLNGMVNG